MLRLRNSLMATVSQLTLTPGVFDEGTIPTQWGDEVASSGQSEEKSAGAVVASELLGVRPLLVDGKTQGTGDDYETESHRHSPRSRLLPNLTPGTHHATGA